jgi:hypothetical protein
MKGPAAAPKPVLYLFSSNRRPRYSQDILDVIAMPAGLVRRFRYNLNTVPPALKDVAAQKKLVGATVIVNFSLQQEVRYQDPVFFPVRGGEVLDVTQSGDILMVRFKLSGLMCLPVPPETDDPEEGLNSYREVAKNYTRAVETAVGIDGVPYRASLGPGKDVLAEQPPPAITGGHPFVELRWAAEYLSRTETFAGASFIHVIGIHDVGESWTNTVANKLLDSTLNSYRLVGGRTYYMHVLQRQATDSDRAATFRVDTNSETISVIGEETFTISSPYDRVIVPLQVLEPKDGQSTETIITVEAVGTQGPSVRIPVIIDPSAGGAGVSAAGGLGVFLVGLAGYTANITAWQKYLFGLGSLLGLLVIGARSWPVAVGWVHRRRARRLAAT